MSSKRVRRVRRLLPFLVPAAGIYKSSKVVDIPHDDPIRIQLDPPLIHEMVDYLTPFFRQDRHPMGYIIYRSFEFHMPRLREEYSPQRRRHCAPLGVIMTLCYSPTLAFPLSMATVRTIAFSYGFVYILAYYGNNENSFSRFLTSVCDNLSVSVLLTSIATYGSGDRT